MKNRAFLSFSIVLLPNFYYPNSKRIVTINHWLDLSCSRLIMKMMHVKIKILHQLGFIESYQFSLHYSYSYRRILARYENFYHIHSNILWKNESSMKKYSKFIYLPFNYKGVKDYKSWDNLHINRYLNYCSKSAIWVFERNVNAMRLIMKK